MKFMKTVLKKGRNKMQIDISRFDSFQKDVIIENSGKDIVVGASAGAGKTMVLVTRILKRCMEDGVSIDRILALTFTAAAAQEMKNRLSKEFHELRKKTDDPKIRDYIDRQISLLVSADITTIDSYCLNVIRRFCAVIGLDPATAENVLSEGKNEALQQEAFRQVLSESASDAEGFERILRLCEYFSPRPQDYGNLYDAVKKINLHAQSAVDPSAWYDKCRHSYKEFKTIRQLPEEIRNAWFDLLDEDARAALKYAEQIHEAILRDPDKKLKPEMIIQSINLLNHCVSCIVQQDYEGYLALLKEAAVNKVLKPADPSIERLRQAMNDRITSLLAISYEQASFAKNSKLHEEIIDSLITLAQNTAKRFRRLKMENTCMNFSDMERYALEILQAGNNAVARKLNHSFDEIMIDEFQDTSFLQDTILSTIAKADRNVPVFRVGDVKQSIYRFRQAKPELMRALMRNDQAAVFNMHYNYRSSIGIVDFTNLLFERVMNVPGSSDHYGEVDHVDVGTSDQRVRSEDPAVCLYLLDGGKSDGSGEAVRLTADQTKAAKASFISQKICEMIAESGGKLRFADFAVLSRSHADQIVLRSSFDRFRIPYDIDAREGFYQSDLCRDILAIAKVMRDPYDEVALCAVLTGPLYSFSDEQLAQAKTGSASFSEGVYTKYPQITEQFDFYRKTARENGIDDLLSAVANTPVRCAGHEEPITFYDALCRKDQANFDFLFDLIIAAGITGLSEMIREMEEGEAESSSEAITTGKGDDVVTVTTIHHSKGLQYKIVFLWGTGSNVFADPKEQILIDDDLMLGIRDIDPEYRIALPTIQRLVVQRNIDKEDLDEFTRLLYVAVTRAQSRLIIVDSESAAKDYRRIIDEGVIRERKGITGLITAALEHENEDNENGLFHVETIFHTEDAQKYYYLTDHLRSHKTVTLPRFTMDNAVLPEIRTPSSLERSRSQSTESDGILALPSFTRKNIGGTSYGTLMHKACEDMPDDAEWTEDLIRQIMDPSLPDKAVKDLYAFGHSDLYERCRQLTIHKEYPFYYENRETRINGTIDLAALSPEKVIIIDFKTDRLKPEEIAEEYAPQLNTYKDVMQSFYPDADIELYAWSFYNGIAIPIEKGNQ